MQETYRITEKGRQAMVAYHRKQIEEQVPRGDKPAYFNWLGDCALHPPDNPMEAEARQAFIQEYHWEFYDAEW